MKPPSFPCGLLISDLRTRKIEYANDFFAERFGFAPLELSGNDVANLFTKASEILFESYLYPSLIKEGFLDETQAVILTANKTRTPVTLNTRLSHDDKVYWSLFISEKRDKLYQELITTRDELEQQTKNLTKLSSVDDLTGLLNRREATRRIHDLMGEASYLHPLTILLIDIDHFKKVNDTYGHQTGDLILKQVAQRLEANFPENHVICRWGGEEFLIALANTDMQTVIMFDKTFHQDLHRVTLNDYHLKVSIGVAEYTGQHLEITLERLIHQADIALYEAKNSGRNKTCFFRQLGIDENHAF
ncbi:hypothetical protein MACH16_01960 [Marinomonas pontica]|uniref:diguanylate cyclase n=1 Tax=Marinomonas pontica TaxID=264739 RepID=A0ABM8F922_9GAMM|nr:GGDEF domain-containing protein [Marinomonas pontica]MCW8357525.1 GGDEF domain-containing protein [Marinomonas pontica]BDX01448.1 hypothetical protein MACH16_01960 [Marinomonas pontica]